MPAEETAMGQSEEDVTGTRWAVLVAGSSGYGNYRHQADVCHAYQILRRGGLKEENIVVFMYDDIAHNPLNPRPGIIINHPQGRTSTPASPRYDYTGEHVNTRNLYAVLLGNMSAVEGGSGKVIDSKPNDRIFLYYSDHGGPGVLGMPNMPFLYAAELIEVLKRKHAMGGYGEMVVYVEACESGSIFEGLMPEDLNIYVTTASNAEESSWGTYCPGWTRRRRRSSSPASATSIASRGWKTGSSIAPSEAHNLKLETIQKQYERVKTRTSNYNTYSPGSHVMEYGSKVMKAEKLYRFQGFDPPLRTLPTTCSGATAAWRPEITAKMTHRVHLDGTVELVGKLLFGSDRGPSILTAVRASGQALVDDWACLKNKVLVFESHCGPLTQYGMKYMRAFANICNEGVSTAAMEEACRGACGDYFKGSLVLPGGRYSSW
ncbi:unnamed protein product [Spirodela intermedia]|uniref:Legumain prodomain domain-containing protein n=1 Tax=Spirodela intermedia TaxID=51605 RepID=A0A7I8IH70_SPIIN|nr:unnamed protein product [Spirodela intermedia]CAA6656202.1 unnamed protein product [Spirodela intermedia]